MRHIAAALAALLSVAVAVPAVAHAPSVVDAAQGTPDVALVLEDPTLSRAIGSTIASPGEVDWFRMDLRSGEPLVVGMTAPDAVGAIAASFILAGPGLPAPDPADPELGIFADVAGAEGAIRFQPVAEPPLENHAGLGFINYGTIRMEAPADGRYYVAVFALDPAATGKYVFAPGVREEFGVDAFGGYFALQSFFSAPWPDPALAEGSTAG